MITQQEAMHIRFWKGVPAVGDVAYTIYSKSTP